jgi:hypothetical protein
MAWRIASASEKRRAGSSSMARIISRSVASLTAGAWRRNEPGRGVSIGAGSTLVSR